MTLDYAPLEEVYTPSPNQQAEVMVHSKPKKTTFNPSDLFKNDKTECNFILFLFIIGATVIMIRR